ncbi:MAG: hypothetical protein M4579_005763 [Chaenotheca gracillima]|nr:MAG: hypothetical protein M4579_005763 [Chaenotheca gracillima]
MPLPRTSALRAVLRQRTVQATRPSARSQIWRPIGRRGYSSGSGHTTKEAGSDWPWLIGALAVTVPSCTYILTSRSGGDDHGHGGHDEKHDEEEQTEDAEGGEAQESSEDQQEDNGEKSEGAGEGEQGQNEGEGSKGNDSSDEGSEGSDGENGGGQDTPDTSDDESSDGPTPRKAAGGDSGVRFKGPTSGEGKNDERLHVPDAKGGAKNRINSGYGNRLAPLDEPNAETPGPDDKPASSKPVQGRQSQSAKQEGLSNTDTKHSTDIANDPGKSKKGEGMPETAKTKGTVDPQRPQV